MVVSRNTELQTSLEGAVEHALERGEVGLAVAVYHEGALVASVVAGMADELGGVPADDETVFWLASVTKGLTALALHVQAERGLVRYDAPVADYWPEFAEHGKDRCTVMDALSHRAGVPIFPLDATPELMNDWDWVCDRIARAHPVHEPGTRNAYHSYTFGWIVGEIVRRTDPNRRALRDFLRDEVFDPLGIDGLWLGIPGEVEPRVANVNDARMIEYVGRATYTYDRIIAVPPQLAASQAVFGRSDVRRSGNPGAGAIGNAPSLARIFALLAEGGKLDGVRLLSDERVHLLYAPRPEGWDHVLGARVRMSSAGYWIANPTEGEAAPMGSGIQVFGHAGAAGNLAWADRTHRLAVAMTANRTVGHGRSTPAENPLAAIAETIRAALGIGQPVRHA